MGDRQEQHTGLLAMARAGAVFVVGERPGVRVVVALFFLFSLTFLPFGRTSPGAHLAGEGPIASQPSRLGGGVWKGLAADSGAEALFYHRIAVDFFCLYEAGALVLAGRDPFLVNRMTGIPWGAQLEGDALAPTRAPWVATFRYPPLAAALLGAPLALFPPWVAYVVWVLFCHLILCFNYFLTLGRAGKHPVMLALVWFAWFPLAVEYYMGQFTFFMSSLILYAALALEKGRASSAALAWGGSVVLKVYTAAMLPLFWLWGMWKGAAVALAVVVGTSLVYFAVVPGSAELFRERGVEGRVLLAPRQPYAGAQGLQEGINAVLWTAAGRSFSTPYRPPETRGTYEVALRAAILLLFGVYTIILGGAVLASRHGFHPGAYGLFWALWLVAYGDCWEHHLVLAQGICAWFLVTGVIGWRTALAVWIFAGAPSLWLVFGKTLGGESMLAETTAGLVYFLQRPVGIVILIAAGVVSFGGHLRRH